MQVKSSRFVISNTNVKTCPKNDLPEYAFIGRSNVGKSSLINSICNKKTLAKTSSTPGKTILINHYLINESWYLVDLPVMVTQDYLKFKKKIETLTKNYFKKRKQLITAFLLIDIRHKPQNFDLEFMLWLNKNLVSFSIIFTKIDKLKTSLLEKNIFEYKTVMHENNWETIPPIFITSSKKNMGKEKVLEYIEFLNSELYKLKKN